MAKLLKLVKKYKGQALTEYAVIFPPVILLAIGAAWILGASATDVYRHVTSIFMGQKECVPQYDHADNSICDEHEYCEKTEYEDVTSGSYTYEDALSVDAIVIKAGKTYEIRRDDPFQFVYTTDDGCYRVTFKTNRIDWEQTGGGSDCQAISHVDAWQAPICQ